eukprot:7697554-Pyramimonas_sp.AAC.3
MIPCVGVAVPTSHCASTGDIFLRRKSSENMACASGRIVGEQFSSSRVRNPFHSPSSRRRGVRSFATASQQPRNRFAKVSTAIRNTHRHDGQKGDGDNVKCLTTTS